MKTASIGLAPPRWSLPLGRIYASVAAPVAPTLTLTARYRQPLADV